MTFHKQLQAFLIFKDHKPVDKLYILNPVDQTHWLKR